MGGFVAAWLTAEGIVIYRQVKVSHKPPVPGQMLGVTILFLALAVVADISPAARPVVTLGAWGLNLAGILQLWPNGLGAAYSAAQTAESNATSSTSSSSSAGGGGGQVHTIA